jgi:hypothetical protein
MSQLKSSQDWDSKLALAFCQDAASCGKGAKFCISDTDILEYEIRQEIIHEMCNQLANSDATA